MHGGHTRVAAGRWGKSDPEGKKCTKWWGKEITDSAGQIGVIFSCCCHIFLDALADFSVKGVLQCQLSALPKTTENNTSTETETLRFDTQ